MVIVGGFVVMIVLMEVVWFVFEMCFIWLLLLLKMLVIFFVVDGFVVMLM